MERKTRDLLQKLIQREELGISLVLMVIIFYFSFTNSRFFSLENMVIVIRQFSIIAIMAIGMNFIVSGGGIDLSVGAILAVTATIVGQTLKMNVSPIIAILLGITTGTFLGYLNGFIVTKLKIREIIATLGMSYILRGSLLFIAGAKWITNLPESFTFIGQGYFIGIPIPIYILIVVGVAASFFSSYTPLGRQIRAMGGNLNAARLSGIDINKLKILTFLLGGLTAGIGGILYAARMGSIQTNAGLGMEFQVIAAALIGGAAFWGEGTPLGAILGAALLGVLSNGLVLSGVSVFWEGAIIGSLIIVATIVNILRRRYETSLEAIKR